MAVFPRTPTPALVIYLEFGTWGYSALGPGTQLTRAAGNGTPGPTEEMAVGDEIILNAGDWIYAENPSDDIRNAGEELWRSGLPG